MSIFILNISQDVLVYLQTKFLDPISSFKFSVSCKYLYNIYFQNVQSKFKIYHQYIQYGEWDMGLREASKNNNWNIVEFFIQKGADDWNRGMRSAAKGGHIHIVEYFIQKGANWWEFGMCGAAKGGAFAFSGIFC
jgi:hypothetical protein